MRHGAWKYDEIPDTSRDRDGPSSGPLLHSTLGVNRNHRSWNLDGTTYTICGMLQSASSPRGKRLIGCIVDYNENHLYSTLHYLPANFLKRDTATSSGALRDEMRGKEKIKAAAKTRRISRRLEVRIA